MDRKFQKKKNWEAVGLLEPSWALALDTHIVKAENQRSTQNVFIKSQVRYFDHYFFNKNENKKKIKISFFFASTEKCLFLLI